MRRPIAPLCCLLLAVFRLPAGDGGKAEADDNPAEPVIDEKVEVREEAPRDADVAAFATRIDRGEFARRGADLGDVLRRVPGARVRDYGGLGSYATMSLRASTSEQVTVLVDGVPQNRALGGPVDLSSIPATQIDRVTVYRGFAPAAYGLGGLGGVVDVRTRDAGGPLRAQVDLLAGELGTTRLSGGASLRTGAHGRLRVGTEWLKSDGDFHYLDSGETLFQADDDVIRRRLNNGVDQASILVRQSSENVGRGELDVGLRVQHRERGLPGLGTFTSESARLEERVEAADLSWSRRYATRVESLDLQADLFHQRIGFADPAGEIGLRSESRTTELAGGGGTATTRARFGSHRALMRVDMRHERAAVTDEARVPSDLGGAQRNLVGVTIEDLFGTGPLTVAPSVRWQYREDDFTAGSSGAVEPAADDVRDSSWSGKVGLAWALGPAASIRGSVGRFYRVPSLVELFGDRGSLIANPTLVPESGVTAELGYARGHRSGRLPWSVELVGFARRAKNLIRFVSVSQGTAVARNLADVESYGVEGSLSARPVRGLTVDASATVQRAEDLSPGYTSGKALPYQPELLAYLGAGYARGRLQARWEATYTGANATDSLDTPELRLPERIIHDVNLELLLPGGFALGVDLRNIFDRRTLDLLRHPLPGRTLFVHLGWRTHPAAD
ncbi:MAG TPA: TonB-dependent receptor [Candidatus Polarisedimenticolaceae bacterium]|nr:TonB-dependent receptor [Candidatus Polarisedimenticolaceae bacterium]